MHATGKSHIGKVREQNQDAYFLNPNGHGDLPNLFVVADGIGGHQSGDIASNRALAAFCDFFDTHKAHEALEMSLAEALQVANVQVYNDSMSNEAFKGMGTTFSAASITADKMHYVHVGDSRIYVIKENEIVQITKDHFTLTEDMVKEGLLTEEEAKDYPVSVLTRAIGTDPDVRIDRGQVRLEGVSHVMICSDGLFGMIDNDDEMFAIIKSTDNTDEAVDKLIKAALDCGGRDNITVILIKCGE